MTMMLLEVSYSMEGVLPFIARLKEIYNTNQRKVSYPMEGVLPGLRKCPIVADVAFPGEDVGKIPVQCTYRQDCQA